jgi:2-oxoglutarate ferredoxin oxidoreductase subunit alpha
LFVNEDNEINEPSENKEFKMDEISLLIGGKAGFGIDKSGAVIGRLLNRLGYRIYIYRDYPSLIRGGHTFCIVRASKDRITTHKEKIDFVIALNQETLQLHRHRLEQECSFIFDADQVKTNLEYNCGIGIALGKILREEDAPELMRNTCIIGALTKAIGLNFNILEEVLKKEFSKDIDLNTRVAQRGYNAARELIKITSLPQEPLPLISGNEAIALGLVKAGLNAYLAYPMTPSSGILHFLAQAAGDFSLDVIHPESETSAILMALGYAYAGKKAAVGTSGGGFCLMTEGLSLAAMAEVPIAIVLGQRPGPSTGLPTYSAQSDLNFALNTGQGEFVRLVVAPGDNEEAYYWSAISLQMSWKYQIPSIIMSDKNLGESICNFDPRLIEAITEPAPFLWNGKPPYKRYLATENGISPLAFASQKDAVIKVNSYEHNELGITTEEPQEIKQMQEKRLGKEKFLTQELECLKPVKVYANESSDTAILCWGSNKGVCLEVARQLGLKVIQPIVLCPFMVKPLTQAVSGVKKIICVENNATGQLTQLLKANGFEVSTTILKYDGRPFSLEELERLVKGAVG